MVLILLKFVILYNILLFLDEQTMIHNLHKEAIYPKQKPIHRKNFIERRFVKLYESFKIHPFFIIKAFWDSLIPEILRDLAIDSRKFLGFLGYLKKFERRNPQIS